MQALLTIFQILDADGNGSISRAELAAGAAVLASGTNETLSVAFALLETPVEPGVKKSPFRAR